MGFEVKIIADSIGPNKIRLTTFQIRYPRIVLAEVNTHRSFSRNASSSRAVPTNKLVEWIESDPFVPIYWGSAKKGMQAGLEVESWVRTIVEKCWLGAFHAVLTFVKIMNGLGLHKQIPNRLLEPWSYINVVLTATDFDNFFTLRCEKNAQPEMQKLAVMMARAYRDSTPTELSEGVWHLPYVTEDEKKLYSLELQKKISTAHCCRVSYLTMEGKPADPEKDFILHDQLIFDKHFSPTEHLAEATNDPDLRSGNFRGWKQYRKSIEGECATKFDFSILDQFEEKDFIIESITPAI